MPGKNLTVEDHAYSVKDHVVSIEESDYGLPEFQRTFVWDDQWSCAYGRAYTGATL
ncbi:hypothetical protein [Candidatus Amarolinea dominans]|uniref:hypothetical protein n=1 Tax=Candidatus Amarolinea dominans TaxID=3140696 RepID=UPI00313553C9|nr:hypothetical protein [Anaerolineae bacterium]